MIGSTRQSDWSESDLDGEFASEKIRDSEAIKGMPGVLLSKSAKVG